MRDIAILPNDLYVVSGGDDGKVIVYDIKTGAVKHKLEDAPDSKNIFAVSCSSNGAYFASAGLDKRVCVWEASTFSLYHIFGDPANPDKYKGHRLPVWGICFAGSNSLISGSIDKSIIVWDVAKKEKSFEVKFNAPVHVVSPVIGSLSEIICGCTDGTVRVVNVEEGSHVPVDIKATQPIYGVVAFRKSSAAPKDIDPLSALAKRQDDISYHQESWNTTSTKFQTECETHLKHFEEQVDDALKKFKQKIEQTRESHLDKLHKTYRQYLKFIEMEQGLFDKGKTVLKDMTTKPFESLTVQDVSNILQFYDIKRDMSTQERKIDGQWLKGAGFSGISLLCHSIGDAIRLHVLVQHALRKPDVTSASTDPIFFEFPDLAFPLGPFQRDFRKWPTAQVSLWFSQQDGLDAAAIKKIETERLTGAIFVSLDQFDVVLQALSPSNSERFRKLFNSARSTDSVHVTLRQRLFDRAPPTDDQAYHAVVDVAQSTSTELVYLAEATTEAVRSRALVASFEAAT